jgi:hypothetical protein
MKRLTSWQRWQRLSHMSKQGEKQHKLVIEARPKVYEDGSKGWEIVKEVALCAKHYETISQGKD